MVSALGSVQNYMHVVFHKYYMMVMVVNKEAKCQPLLISLGISHRQLWAVNRPVTSGPQLSFPLNASKEEGKISLQAQEDPK